MAPMSVVAQSPSFQKPSAGGKPKPSGGKVTVSKPSVIEASSQFQSNEPTSVPTKESTLSPTEKLTIQSTVLVPDKSDTLHPTTLSTPPLSKSPTSHPTKALDSNFIHLSSESVNVVLVTSAPTQRLTKAPQASNGLADPSSTTATDSGCSGDPCPVSTWCRSRYGSCGPGIVYCNSFSTWKSSCPLVAPEKRPTIKPTSKPARTPATISISPTPVPVAREPTLPPIARPTLPTITGSANVLTSKSLSSHSVENIEKNSVKDSDIESTDEQKKEVAKSSVENTFQSAEYLTEWTEWTQSRKSGGSATHFARERIPSSLIFVLLSSFSLMFII